MLLLCQAAHAQLVIIVHVGDSHPMSQGSKVLKRYNTSAGMMVHWEGAVLPGQPLTSNRQAHGTERCLPHLPAGSFVSRTAGRLPLH